MFNFNIELAVQCVKCVVDNTQCFSCDKLIGPCVRFPCGHSVCESCAQRTRECFLCISSAASFIIDKPQSARVSNASALLTAFQETFKIDVYKRQRFSDHLKLEKQVFPKCIQAPHKYANKRKSLNISYNNKENIGPKTFPGEETNSSDIVIMKKSVEYVQNWLNQHEGMPQNLPRRPFGDINVNTQSLVHRTKNDKQKYKNVVSEVKTKQSKCKKKLHHKSIYKTSSLLNNLEIETSPRQLKSKKDDNKFGISQIAHKCDKNESGIVLDDEPHVIDDTGSNVIEKDYQACLAVLEADAKDEYENKVKNNHQNEKEINQSFQNLHQIADSLNKNKPEEIYSRFQKKVLFYKRSSLFETCNLCNQYMKTKMKSTPEVDKFNNVSIVINNSAFITTIKITQCEENNQLMINKNSVAIQTDSDFPPEIDFCENITPQKRKNMTNTHDVPRKILKTNSISQSLDVFGTEKNLEQIYPDNKLLKQQKCIIEDSETDSDISCDNTHEVIADVHRPNAPETVECGVLRTLSTVEYGHKTKRQIRGHTPNSSNSSDKENLDPNRKKKVKIGKKHKNKK